MAKYKSLKKFRMPWGIDWTLFLIPTLLALFGLTIIYTVSYSAKPMLFFSQIIYLAIGLAVAAALTFVDYRNLRGLYLVLYAILIALLIVVLIFGDKTMGASRWINLKIFQLQPSEIGKPILILVMARFVAFKENFNWRDLLLLLAIVGAPLVLILIQPDFGTAMVIFVGFITMLFFSKINKLIIVAFLAGLVLITPVGWHFLKDYQKQRIYTFINPASDPYGSGYNVKQAKITVGTGGLWGEGIGNGTQIQLNFLPIAHTDFIFASSAEAVGFVGSVILILLLIFLIVRILNTARLSKDLFGYYFAATWGMVLLFQIFVNIGMNLGIMPVTGIPLPFVSHGGSSLITNLAVIGILQSIYLRHRKIAF